MTKAIAAPFWWMTSLIFGYSPKRPAPEPRQPSVPYFDESHLTNRPGAVIPVLSPGFEVIQVTPYPAPPPARIDIIPNTSGGLGSALGLRVTQDRRG